jgi:hypothetical protein
MYGVFLRFYAEVLLSNMGCLSGACLVVWVRGLSVERVCGIFGGKWEPVKGHTMYRINSKYDFESQHTKKPAQIFSIRSILCKAVCRDTCES